MRSREGDTVLRISHDTSEVLREIPSVKQSLLQITHAHSFNFGTRIGPIKQVIG